MLCDDKKTDFHSDFHLKWKYKTGLKYGSKECKDWVQF